MEYFETQAAKEEFEASIAAGFQAFVNANPRIFSRGSSDGGDRGGGGSGGSDNYYPRPDFFGGSGGVGSGFGYNVSGGSSIFEVFGKIPETVLGATNATVKELQEDTRGYLDNIREIQLKYGSFSNDIIGATGAGAKAFERYQELVKNFTDQESGESMTKKLGFTKELNEDVKNYFTTYFKNEAIMAQRSDDIVSKLQTQHSAYINELDKITENKLPTYTEALGVSAETVASVIERQIVTTGKASTEVLDNVAAYSFQIHKETGMPMKEISRFATQMIADTKQFGIVTEEEATRAAASLMQVGFRYSDLVEMQNKFSDFESTADIAGIVSQITGVQLDAMELSFRMSEDPESGILYLRDQLISQGFTPEMFKSLGKDLQRQLQSTLGRDMNQIFGLIDPSRKTTDISTIESSQEMIRREIIDSGGAFAIAAREGLDPFTRSTDTLNDVLLRIRKRGLFEFVDELVAAQKETGLLAASLDKIMPRFLELEEANAAAAEAAVNITRQSRQNTQDLETRIISAGDIIYDGLYGDTIAVTQEMVNQEIINGLAPEEYVYDEAYNMWHAVGEKISGGINDGTANNHGESLSPFMRDKIVNPMIDPANYDPYMGGIYEAGNRLGKSFSDGTSESLMIEDSMTIAKRLLSSSEDISEQGYLYGMSFGKGVEKGYVNTSIGSIGLENRLNINSEDVGLDVINLTNSITAELREEQKNAGGQKIFSEVLQPIVESIRDEIVLLKNSQIESMNRENVTNVSIGEEQIVRIVKNGIIRNPQGDENAIQVITSG